MFITINGGADSQFELLGYLLCPGAYYAIGRSIVRKKKRDSEIITFLMLLVIVSCTYLYISIAKDIQMVGLINPMRSITTDGEKSMGAATLLGVTASLGFAGISYPIVCGKTMKSFRSYVFILLLILSILSVVHLINRTGIVVVAIAGLCTTLYAVNGQYKKLLPILTIFVVTYIVLFYTGILGNEVLDAYEDRSLNEENTGTANGRFDRWIDAFSFMIQYPLGWSTQRFSLYCHSLWFDVARVSGIIPFAALLVPTYKVVINSIKMVKVKNDKIVGTLLGFIVCTILSAAMEPIMEGASTYFYTMCLIWGIQNEYMQQISKL